MHVLSAQMVPDSGTTSPHSNPSSRCPYVYFLKKEMPKVTEKQEVEWERSLSLPGLHTPSERLSLCFAWPPLNPGPGRPLHFCWVWTGWGDTFHSPLLILEDTFKIWDSKSIFCIDFFFFFLLKYWWHFLFHCCWEADRWGDIQLGFPVP